jgi:hypothetical protein
VLRSAAVVRNRSGNLRGTDGRRSGARGRFGHRQVSVSNGAEPGRVLIGPDRAEPELEIRFWRAGDEESPIPHHFHAEHGRRRGEVDDVDVSITSTA